MKRLYLIIIIGLVVILTNSYSSYTPVINNQQHGEAAEGTIEIPDTQITAEYQQPLDPLIARVPDTGEFDPKLVLSYIKEQCYIAGVDYKFAVSLLREENSLFFGLFEGISPQEFVFEARNRNDNGSIDYGLWQLNGNYLWVNFIPNYWHGLYEFDWANPFHNTYVAVRHIRWLYTSLQRYNNEKGIPQLANSLYWETAMAYNAGLDRIRGGSRPTEKTLDYAARIFARVY